MTTQQAKFSIIKKIGTKTVYGKVTVRDIPQGGELPLFQVFGRAVAKKVIETQYGESIVFQGDFRAINAKGERFASMVCFLPPDAAALVAAQMDGGVVVEFAFKIGVNDNPDSPVGYAYTVEPIQIAEGGRDPLAHLVERVTGEAPALPDPNKNPQETARKRQERTGGKPRPAAKTGGKPKSKGA